MPIPDELLDRSRGWITLPGGLELYLVLPSSRDIAHMPGMSWPLIYKMTEIQERLAKEAKAQEGQENPEPVRLTAEEQEARVAFKKAMVSNAVKAFRIDGREEPLNMEPNETSWLDESEFELVYRYADRALPLPKATEPTGKDSLDSVSQTVDSPGLEPANGSVSIQHSSSKEKQTT